jgi:Predicted SAM-dependent RNA methyltransferase
MRTLAGPDASVAFTNLSSATSASLSAAFTNTNTNPPAGTAPDSASPAAAAQVECYEQGVLSLMQSRNILHERVCLLDPKASLALSPSDGDTGKFTWFLFGVRASLSLPLSSPLRLSFFLRCHLIF